MKIIKIFILLFVFNIMIYANDKYPYPFKNPYVATIVGSSVMMDNSIPESIPSRDLEIKTLGDFDDDFWYAKDFKYSLAKQKKKAPLIYMIAGTGSGYNSLRMKYLERIFYSAGYHVVSISSVFNNNFVLNVSREKMPGIIYDDSKDTYEIMKKIQKNIEKDIEISDIYLTGYSLGGTEAAMIGEIDSVEKYFDFKRILLLNPAIDGYKSSKKIDDMLDVDRENTMEEIGKIIDKLIVKIGQNINTEYVNFDIETIMSLFAKEKIPDEEMRNMIGLVFRIVSIDVSYISSISNGLQPKPKSLYESFLSLNFISFNEYVNNIAYPYFKNKYGYSFEEVSKKATLECIEEYLKKADNIAMVTNRDELILDSEDFVFIEKVFGKRAIIYPYGGHCGNMFFPINIKVMLNYLKTGELKYEI